eukprot:3882114-Alexandrium_andersonii.AAC.1
MPGAACVGGRGGRGATGVPGPKGLTVSPMASPLARVGRAVLSPPVAEALPAAPWLARPEAAP